MPVKKFKLRHTFWLDLNRPDEADLADYVAELKSQRRFVTTIRQGLRLIRDLRAGNTTILLELFPAVRTQLQSNTELLTLLAALINQQPTLTNQRYPEKDITITVQEADPEARKKLSVQNTMASLADF